MLRIIVKLWKGHKRQIIPGVLCILIQVWMDLTVPDYMETITVLVKTPGSSMDEIVMNGVYMLLCAALSVAGAIAASFFCVRMAASFSMELRSEIFDRIESYTMEEIDTFTRASLITRSTNDITQVQGFMSRGLQQSVRAPIMIVLALVKLSGKYWQWSAMTAVAVAVMICLLIFMIRYAHPRLRRRQALTDDLSRLLRENLTGIRVIRAYNAQPYQQKRFDAANDILTDSEMKAHQAMGLMRPTVKFLNNALMVGIYCIGAMLIVSAGADEQLTIFSSMVVYTSYAAILIQAFLEFNGIFNILPRAQVSAGRIFEVLDREPSVRDGAGADNARPAASVSTPSGIGDQNGVEGDPTGTVHVPDIPKTAPRGAALEFRHVSFRYPGAREDVLHDISFRADPGQTVAVIGSTGSGKTTVANLVPRLYDVTGGAILLDGVDIREYSQQELRNRIGYAAQSAFLFTGTVRSNVSYGDNGRTRGEEESLEAVRRAVRIAQAEDFTQAMQGGLDAGISRGGTNVSGGQRQRLSIARAVYRDPELFIFDDTFSALDYRTDRALRTQLKRSAKGVTTLLIAQRIGTILDADRILVMDEGRIVGEGRHDDLMQTCEIYREIARTQLEEEMSA